MSGGTHAKCIESWNFQKIACGILLLGVAGCQKPATPTSSSAPLPSAVQATAPTTPMPDAGSLQTQTVRATGSGSNAEEAINSAIRTAVLSANGASVDLNSAQMSATLQVATGIREADLRAKAFAEIVSERSGGAITDFNLIDLSKPSSGNGEYSATIGAKVVKFRVPADSNRLKIVVAPLRFSAITFDVASHPYPADQIASDIQRQVIDDLTQTNRFAVLDRDYSPEILQELDLISSGQASTEQYAKLGQALPADVIWVGTIDAFQYHRQAKSLSSSDRQLVGYSGSAVVSQRLLNVATRQIVLSDTLTEKPADIEPTTLPINVDSVATLHDMESELASKIAMMVTQQLFPITVVSRTGDQVVLSQGGKSVVEHHIYQVVTVGDAIKDPQTGQIIGRSEKDCCTVTVDRVTPSMAYGHLNGMVSTLNQLPPGALQLRNVVAIASTGISPETATTAKPTNNRPTVVTAPQATPPTKDNNW